MKQPIIPTSAQSVAVAELELSSRQLPIPEKENELLVVQDQTQVAGATPPTREQIIKLEQALKTLPQLEIETNHYRVAGLYAREIRIPAGTILTGKVHKAEHLNIVSQGEIIVWTEAGMKHIKAPFVLPSYPGAKRVGLALVDTVWVTIHATDKTDLDELEEELIEPSNPALDGEVKKWLGLQ